MNKKLITEFRFRKVKMRLQPRLIISTTSICIILHVTLSLIESLLK